MSPKKSGKKVRNVRTQEPSVRRETGQRSDGVRTVPSVVTPEAADYWREVPRAAAAVAGAEDHRRGPARVRETGRARKAGGVATANVVQGRG